MDVSSARSVVYAADGSRHKVCWSKDEERMAIEELAAEAGTAVVFSRKKREAIVNSVHGNVSGPTVMVGKLVGGVNIQ